MAAISLTYNGKTYTRVKSNWVDKNFQTARHLRRELDSLYFKTLDLDSMTIDAIMNLADEFKVKAEKDDPNSPDLAADLYKRIMYSCDEDQLKGLLSKLSSCYRQLVKPQQSIELFEEAKNNYGETIITPPFLTSVGAAYCDLKNYLEAKRFADRAFAKAGGKADPELKGLYARIRKETTGSGKYDG